MKRLLAIGLFLITILAMGVSAGDISLSTLSTVAAKPTKGFSTTFSVTNNGTANLTGLSVSMTTTELNGFNISFSPSSFNLNAGLVQAVTVTGEVPEDVNTRLSPFSGTITVSGATGSESISLDVNAESQLRLDNVKFLVDSKSKSIGEGDTRGDVLPGAKLEIKGDIDNIFSDDDDIEIQDVTIEITIESIDDEGDDDLEGDDDVGDIKADDTESFSIEFEIPEDVEDGDYDVIILVEGEDENGAKHSVEWKDVKLSVEKDKHNIVISKASISPSRVSCSRNVDIDVRLKNQGRSDEDEVVLIIESPVLEIDREDASISVEEGTGEDTEYDETYSFTIGDKVNAGTYAITLKAYYDTDTLSDSERVDLIVEKCAVEEPQEEKKEEVVVVAPPPVTKEEEAPEIITTPIAETTEVSLFQSSTYMFILMAAIGFAVIVIIIMIIVLLTMKRRG